MNAPETAVAAAPAITSLFINVPDYILPSGLVVPGFRVGQFLSSKDAADRVVITAEGTPWTSITFQESREAAQAAGFNVLTETQALSIAHNVAGQDCNWTGGKVGLGKLFRGIRKSEVSSAQAGNFTPKDAKERRWLTLSNGEKICDFNGNAFQWIADDIQGDANGLTTIIKLSSPSLQAPFPSMRKGMGWRPDYECDWSGDALVRGGFWDSGDYAGAFRLYLALPDLRDGIVGFRCTLPGL